MASANESPGRNLRLSLAGLQAGMLGALIMLGWLALSSVWYRRSIWSVPNLLSSTFFGDTAFRNSFNRMTFSGLALHLTLYSLVGVIFALAVRDRAGRLRATLIGMIAALVWYYLMFGFIWKAVNPTLALYSPDRSMLIGHLLYGGILGKFRGYAGFKPTTTAILEPGLIAAPAEQLDSAEPL
jgi:hypothetical protein